MNFFKNLNPFAFIIAFAIGIFLTYVMQPPLKVIIKHPTPQNAGRIIYKDNNDSCFTYSAKEITCPSDNNQIIDHPIEIN
jgi:hypothetical protein